MIIAVVFGGALLTGLGTPILAAVGGSLLQSGKVTTEALIALIPIICAALFFLVIFGVVLIVFVQIAVRVSTGCCACLALPLARAVLRKHRPPERMSSNRSRPGEE